MNYTKPEVVLNAHAATVIKGSQLKGRVFIDANQVDLNATSPAYEGDE